MAQVFNWSGLGFATKEDFREYVLVLARYPWIRGFVLHHTGVPELKDWRGQRSVDGAKSWYRDTKRWSGGPHLFVAAGSPADGVWLGTPLSTPGVHAGNCNPHYVGVEIVGNYNRAPWTPLQTEYIFFVFDSLFDWIGLPVNSITLKGHRECMSNRDCPGLSIELNSFRHNLNLARAHLPAYTEYWVRWVDTRVRRWPATNSAIITKLSPGKEPVRVRRTLTGAQVTSNGVTSNQWAELTSGGYIWLPLLSKNVSEVLRS